VKAIVAKDDLRNAVPYVRIDGNNKVEPVRLSDK
jgi:hypothetical protein